MARSRQPRGVKPRIQRINKIRLTGARLNKPILRRRISNAPTWASELEEYALPPGALQGYGHATILERLVGRRLNDLKVSYTFQYNMKAGLLSVRIDFAVWNVGFSPLLAIEPDGYAWHQQASDDYERDLMLFSEGITNIHIYEADIMHSRERFEYAVDQALLGRELPRPPGTVRTMTFE